MTASEANGHGGTPAPTPTHRHGAIAVMPSAQRISQALDVLRGIAAVLMVVNHIGAQLVGRPVLAAPGSALAFFVSSAAPVLFFFATGFAGALRPASGGWLGRLRTVICLEIADLLFAFSRHLAVYLDFFGFIALSALVVDGLANRRYAARWAAAAALALLLARYALAPLLVDASSGQPWLAWLVGFPSTPYASYPLTPWLCFPLAGFALGRWCRQRAAGERSWSLPIVALAVVTAVAAAGAVWASRSGHSMNRWSEVASGYAVAAVGILGVAIALSLAATALSGSARRALSLRGVAAYAVVPLHYAIITALLFAGLAVPPGAAYLVVAAALAALVLLLSRRWAGGLQRLAGWRPLRGVAAAVVAVCAALCWWATAESPGATALALTAQLALSAWLLPAPRRAEIRSRTG